ncbi:P-loop containing nucleoside triphosphate hydrolase protein [Lipomyces japonicus]|uniref:P-loop containing nucleoside triphosphate hydrolase protein n=1 Tax=Lipomyces japonicus TaxID=56871 RepID=UPI0034CD01A9
MLILCRRTLHAQRKLWSLSSTHGDTQRRLFSRSCLLAADIEPIADANLQHENFRKLLRQRISALTTRSKRTHIITSYHVTSKQFDDYAEQFSLKVVSQLDSNSKALYRLEGASTKIENYLASRPTFPNLAILKRLQSESQLDIDFLDKVDTVLTECLVNYALDQSSIELETQKKPTKTATKGWSSSVTSRRMVNMSHPAEWYPKARAMKRKIYVHVGPTNSGKTYYALQRLRKANRGVFAGPLRLLAREIYERFTADDIPCNLVTGEEVIRSVDKNGQRAGITSSTVEMVDVEMPLDVAVIDEIQMIADPERGWSWTVALLGLQAKEIHLCGEERAVPILKAIAESLGEELEVRYFKRLSPLQVQSNSLGSNIQKIEPGDAVVTFSRRNIFAIKQKIERETRLKCAVIYGGLPPETRARQAQLFNDPDSEHNVLIASDAIGMGLNLSIRRVVFESVVKFNGVAEKSLEVHHLKQIAGRAGRYKPERTELGRSKTMGYVTSLDKADHAYVVNCMARENMPISHAGIHPMREHIKRFTLDFPPTIPFDFILAKFYSLASSSRYYTVSSLDSAIGVSRALNTVKGLTIDEKIKLSSAPVNLRDDSVCLALIEMTKAIANGEPLSLADVAEFNVDALQFADVSKIFTLKTLERAHLLVTLYLWLSYRFPTVLFDREGAMDFNMLIQDLIDKCLQTIRFTRRLSRSSVAGQNNYTNATEKQNESETDVGLMDIENQFVFKSSFAED